MVNSFSFSFCMCHIWGAWMCHIWEKTSKGGWMWVCSLDGDLTGKRFSGRQSIWKEKLSKGPLGLERWLRGWDHLLLFQRTQACFPELIYRPVGSDASRVLTSCPATWSFIASPSQMPSIKRWRSQRMLRVLASKTTRLLPPEIILHIYDLLLVSHPPCKLVVSYLCCVTAVKSSWTAGISSTYFFCVVQWGPTSRDSTGG